MQTDCLVACHQGRGVEQPHPFLEGAPRFEVVECREGTVVAGQGERLSHADLSRTAADEIDEDVDHRARDAKELPGLMARLVNFCVTRHPFPRCRSGSGDLGGTSSHHRPATGVS